MTLQIHILTETMGLVWSADISLPSLASLLSSVTSLKGPASYQLLPDDTTTTEG